MITVRLAGFDDLPEVVRGARAFAQEAGVEHLVAGALGESLRALLKLDVVRVYLAETDEVVGGLGVSIQPFLWNRALVEMSELFFWVYPGSPATAALALLRRVMLDAEAEKVDLATFVRLETSPGKLGHVYERLGFRRLQETYLKEFSWL